MYVKIRQVLSQIWIFIFYSNFSRLLTNFHKILTIRISHFYYFLYNSNNYRKLNSFNLWFYFTEKNPNRDLPVNYVSDPHNHFSHQLQIVIPHNHQGTGVITLGYMCIHYYYYYCFVFSFIIYLVLLNLFILIENQLRKIYHHHQQLQQTHKNTPNTHTHHYYYTCLPMYFKLRLLFRCLIMI